MHAFAEAWLDGEFVQPVVALLPWGHNVRLLDAASGAAVSSLPAPMPI
jgi:hypothetical protein